MSHLRQLTEDEKVVVCIRDHWVVLLKPFMVFVMGIIVSGLMFYASFLLGRESVQASVVSLVTGLLVLFVTVHLTFIYVFSWQVSTWLITTKRVVDFKSLVFVRDDSFFIELADIRQIEKQQRGFMPNILNYGIISINVPDTTEYVQFDYIPDPDRFISVIQNLQLQIASGQKIDMSKLKNVY